MSFAKKTLIIVGGTTLLVGGSYAIINLMNLEKINVNVRNVRIHKLDLSGLELRTDIELNNTTRARATITQPFMQLFNKNRLIAQTPLANKNFIIEPNKKTLIEGYKINVGLIPLLQTMGTSTVNLVPIVSEIFAKGKTIPERLEAMKKAQLGLDMVARIELFANQWKITKNERIKV